MIVQWAVLLATFSLASSSSLRVLFPELKQYSYILKINTSTGLLLTPEESESSWTLEGRLLVQVYDDFTRVRFKLEDLKVSIYSKSYGFSSDESNEATDLLAQPWEVDYQENGYIRALYVDKESTWVTNVKRALSINFQLKKESGSYTATEPYLYDSCDMVYTTEGNTIKKSSSLALSWSSSEHSWTSVPSSADFGRAVPEATATAERVYQLDDKGLVSLNLNENFHYKVHELTLVVSSKVLLYHDTDTPSGSVEKLNLKETSIQYSASDYADPTNAAPTVSQRTLAKEAQEEKAHPLTLDPQGEGRQMQRDSNGNYNSKYNHMSYNNYNSNYNYFSNNNYNSNFNYFSNHNYNSNRNYQSNRNYNSDYNFNSDYNYNTNHNYENTRCTRNQITRFLNILDLYRHPQSSSVGRPC